MNNTFEEILETINFANRNTFEELTFEEKTTVDVSLGNDEEFLNRYVYSLDGRYIQLSTRVGEEDENGCPYLVEEVFSHIEDDGSTYFSEDRY